MRAFLAAAVAACLLLSGCTIGGEDVPRDDSPLVIADPNDFSYLNATNASMRPHVHDYWGGQTRLLFAEGDLSHSSAQYAGLTNTGGKNDPMAIPDGSMVIPGTRWVNITVTWRNENQQFPVEFYIDYNTANASTGRVKVPSGQTVSIDVSEEMNDLAHAKRTRWIFKGHAQGSGQTWAADIKAQVRIEIARTPGPLPFAPPHNDTWGQNRTQSLFGKAEALNDLGGAKGGSFTGGPPISPSLAPVPIETKTLTLRFTYNSTTHTALHYNPVLDYRPADRGTNAPAFAMKPSKREPRNVGGNIEWTIEVKPEMWDSPYARASDWSFTIFWGGETGGSRSTAGANWMQGDYRLEAIAAR